MVISRDLHDELVAHASDEAPNECCGMIAVSGDRFTAYFPARNEYESPMRFMIDSARPDPDPQRDRGPRRGAGDLPLAPEDGGPPVADRHQPGRPAGPGSLWVICSLAADDPAVRVFEIDGNEVEEVELVVE